MLAGARAVLLSKAVEDVRQEIGKIPVPLSLTTIEMLSVDFCKRRSILPPLGVNLTALVKRFQTICWSRFESQVIVTESTRRSAWIEISLAVAAGEQHRSRPR